MVRDIVEIGWCLIDLAMPGLSRVDPARFRLGPMPGGTIEEAQHPLKDRSGGTHRHVGKIAQAEVANVAGMLLCSGIRYRLIFRITLRCAIRDEAREGTGTTQDQDQDNGDDEAKGKANDLGEEDITDDQDNRGGDEAGAQSLRLSVGLDMRRNAINEIRGRFMVTLGQTRAGPKRLRSPVDVET